MKRVEMAQFFYAFCSLEHSHSLDIFKSHFTLIEQKAQEQYTA